MNTLSLDLVIRLREIRKMNGLSQKEAARLSGVGEKTISSFESGDRIGSLKVAQLGRLLRVYGMTEEEFFGETCANLILGETVDPRLREINDLATELQHLPEDVCTGLLKAFRAMTNAATSQRSR